MHTSIHVFSNKSSEWGVNFVSWTHLLYRPDSWRIYINIKTMDYIEWQPPHDSQLIFIHFTGVLLTTVYFYQGQPGTLGQHPPSQLTDQNIHHLLLDKTTSQHVTVYELSQWETTLQCIVISYWLGAFPNVSWEVMISSSPGGKVYDNLWNISFLTTIHGNICNYINNLVQDCGISSVSMIEILQSCAKPSCDHSNGSAQDTISSALEIEKSATYTKPLTWLFNVIMSFHEAWSMSNMQGPIYPSLTQSISLLLMPNDIDYVE